MAHAPEWLRAARRTLNVATGGLRERLMRGEIALAEYRRREVEAAAAFNPEVQAHG